MPATAHDHRTATEDAWAPASTSHSTTASSTGATPGAETAGIGGASSHAASGAVSHWADDGHAEAARVASLGRGAHGPKVEKLQQDLNARGTEPPLKLTGVFDAATVAAVKAFQKRSGLASTGTVDAKTQTALDTAASTPDMPMTQDSLGKHVAKKMDMANGGGPYSLDAGIHYSYNYEYECEEAGQKSRWNDDMRMGYADPQYFDRIGFMDWRLKPGRSASAAIKAWLRGLTVAECNSAVVAMQIDAVRAAISDHKFDALFGQPGKEIADDQRLRIKPGTDGTPVENLMKSPDMTNLKRKKEAAGGKLTDEDMNKTLHVGEWYYFYNHPKYLLKHPGGAWQGENSLYMGVKGGQRMWSGLGASNVSEDGMYNEMVSAYNAPRDANDERVMREIGVKKADGTYADPKYDPKNHVFTDKVTKAMILNDPAYSEIDGTPRKGGFLAEAGITLDVNAVKDLAAHADGNH